MADNHPPNPEGRKVLAAAITKILVEMEERWKKRHPNEFLMAQAYGLFLIYWQTFEEILEFIIHKEARLTRVHASIIISGLGFERKASIARSLLALKGTDHKNSISIINRIISNAERNTLIHGILRVEGDRARFIKRTTDNAMKMKAKSLTHKDMLEKTLKIIDDTKALEISYGITAEQIHAWEKTTDSLLKRFSTSPKPPS